MEETPKRKQGSESHKNGFTLFELLERTLTPEKTIAFCQEWKLLPQKVCCTSCKAEIQPAVCESSIDGMIFKCSHCQVEVPHRTGTWFEKSSLGLRKILIVTYCWAHGFSREFAANETDLPLDTIEKCYSCCRAVCGITNERQLVCIGGPKVTVEVGESRYSDSLNKSEENFAIFGALERGTTKFIAEMYDERSPENVRDFVEKYIRPGSVIMTGSDEIYSLIHSKKYWHFKIDRTNNRSFVDARDPNIHIQGVNCTWHRLKWQVKTYMPSASTEFLPSHLDEFVYRVRNDENKDSFKMFAANVADIFPVNKLGAEAKKKIKRESL